MWHTAGTVVLATDSGPDNKDAFRRLLEGELAGTQTSQPVFVTNLLHHVKRGTEQSQIYWVEVFGEPIEGEFYAFDSLPDNLVDTQMDFIPLAVKHFEATLD